MSLRGFSRPYIFQQRCKMLNPHIELLASQNEYHLNTIDTKKLELNMHIDISNILHHTYSIGNFSTAVSTAVLMQSVLCKLYIEVWKSGQLDFGRMDCWGLEIWTIGLWIVGPLDYNLIQLTIPLTAVP